MRIFPISILTKDWIGIELVTIEDISLVGYRYENDGSHWVSLLFNTFVFTQGKIIVGSLYLPSRSFILFGYQVIIDRVRL